MATNAELRDLIGTGPPPSVTSQMGTMRWAKINPPQDIKTSFAGKTVIVTGSNTGVGLYAAIKFANNGASKVVLAVRTPAKGEAAKQSIIEVTQRSADDIHVMKLDMSDWASVRAFASNVSTEYDTIDIVVLNAGLAAHKYIKSEIMGYESALQVNTLSTAYLAMLLMPKLKSTAAKKGTFPQLTITGSMASKYVTAADAPPSQSLLDKINDPANFNPAKAYGEVKLMTQYVRQGLVDDFSRNEAGETDVYINVVCPGYCTTDLGRDFPWYLQLPY